MSMLSGTVRCPSLYYDITFRILTYFSYVINIAGDLVPTRRWKLCEKDDNGVQRWYIAILQSDSRSEFNTREYSNCMQALTGFRPLDPPTGGTFVTHHMVFHKRYVTELLDLMLKVTESSQPWPLEIMSHSRKFYRFSEYKTYATFMMRFHPEHFFFHPLKMFGEGGLRFREANEVVEEMLSSVRFSNGGLSYTQVKDFFLSKQQSADGKCIPAYVQLDHVYGLDGVDLNLSGPIPASRENFSLRAFSQLKELREIRSSQDIPADLFLEPVNVAVVRECGGVVDDSAIQRMTFGSVMRTPFAHKQLTNQTTPRRPLLQKYFLGAESSSKSNLQLTPLTCALTPSSSIHSSNSLDSFDDDTIEGSSSGRRTPVKITSPSALAATSYESENDQSKGRLNLFTLFAPLKTVLVPAVAGVPSSASVTRAQSAIAGCR